MNIPAPLFSPRRLSLAGSKWSILGLLANVLLSGCTVTVPSITMVEQEQLAQQDQAILLAAQKVPAEPLTLYEAMARSLKYNLDLRQKWMEEALSKKQEEVSQRDMLPGLIASAGYSSRTPVNAAISKSVASGLISQEASVSSDPISRNMDLTLSWNWLDFGLSYFQARQDGNKALVQREYRRKAAHNLMRDVRFAFWKAAAAQSLERDMVVIRKATGQALEEARQVEQEGLRSPIYALQFQLGMLEVMRQIEKSLADLSLAREDLAVLINLAPGTPYRLCDDSGAMDTALAIGASPETLEQIALSSRPELLIERYQARIEADETRKAMARLFPGLELNLSKNFDGNTYLVNQHWVQAGARLSWNLLQTVTGQSSLDLSDQREEVVRMRRLVAHMAVLSQTRIAYQEYQTAHDMLQRAVIENATRQRMQKYSADRSDLGLESQLSAVHAAASLVLGRIQQYEAYARYHNALGHLYATLGLDPLQEEGAHGDIDRMVRQLRENEARWQQTIFPPITPAWISSKEAMAPFPVADLLGDKAMPDQPAPHAVVTMPDPLQPVSSTPEAKPLDRSAPPFVVQVIASGDAAEIDTMVAYLKAQGYQPYVNRVHNGDGHVIMQVWIGRYEKMADAQAAMEHYRASEQRPVFVRMLTGR
ncbi:MAG: TolC family protein [Nitrospirae bacterium]|nr:TolC family protein [Magnetococcales bacterium]